MSRIRQLALNWLAQAEEEQRDAAGTRYAASVCQSLRDWAATRTNCAVELMRVLQQEQEEQESPVDADARSVRRA